MAAEAVEVVEDRSGEQTDERAGAELADVKQRDAQGDLATCVELTGKQHSRGVERCLGECQDDSAAHGLSPGLREAHCE